MAEGKENENPCGLEKRVGKMRFPFACKLSEILLSSTMQCLERKPLHCLSWIYKKNPMGGKLFPIGYLVKTTSQFLQFMLQ